MGFRDYMLKEEFFDRIILGEVDTVSTIGIMTAENPNGRKYVKTSNEKKNEDFLEYLNKKGYQPVQIKGKFLGKQENAYLIINISKQELIELGKRYGQDVVIFGENLGKRRGMEFYYIRNGRSVGKGRLKIDQPENQWEKNSYLSIGRQKYTISFSSVTSSALPSVQKELEKK